MSFDPGFAVGEVVNNDQLRAAFKCGPQGGMRRSNATNTLVLISNHVESIYDDRWIGEVFHYTGMGMKGNQSLRFMQNRTLAESRSNGVDIHLFEVDQEAQYRYQGRVQLSGDPYQEMQADATKAPRAVWVFPLQLSSGVPVPLTRTEFVEAAAIRQKKARRLTLEELRAKAEAARTTAGQRSVLSTEYERDPYVAAYARLRAGGRCELCGNEAPFKNSKGEPYLESHHLEWLARGGKDSVDNTVALCPNCHRKMHVVNSEADKAKLALLLRAST